MDKVRQLEAAVRLKQIRYNCGKCSLEELNAAKKNLKNARDGKPAVSLNRAIPKKEKSPSKELLTEDFKAKLSDKQASLLEIRELRVERDELSNQLHLIPPNQNCQELTTKLVILTKKIESKWTAYKGNILQTNKVEESTLIESEDLLRLKDQRNRFGSERRKLNFKLRQKGNKPHLKEKWKIRLSELNEILIDLDERIRILKNQ